MPLTNDPSALWRPDCDFLKSHLFWPFLLALLLLSMPEWTDLDLRLGDAWFAWEGGYWSLRNHWLTSGLIHEGGRKLVFGIALVLFALLVASFLSARMHPLRKTLVYAVVCILAVTGSVASLKHFSGIPCPWSLQRYGGELAYRHNLSSLFDSAATGQCFPAGHASGGYALLTLYFAALGRVRRAWPWLLPGLVLGLVFGLGQQARGAHFFSHDLWTLAICWFGSLAVFMLMKPYAKFERGQVK